MFAKSKNIYTLKYSKYYANIIQITLFPFFAPSTPEQMGWWHLQLVSPSVDMGFLGL